MDVPEATTLPVSSWVRFLDIARSILRDMQKRGLTSFDVVSRYLRAKIASCRNSEKLSDLMSTAFKQG